MEVEEGIGGITDDGKKISEKENSQCSLAKREYSASRTHLKPMYTFFLNSHLFPILRDKKLMDRIFSLCSFFSHIFS